MDYPKIERSNYSEILHGIEVKDPYRFMEEEGEKTSRWTIENNELLDQFLNDDYLEYFKNRLEDIVDIDRYSPLIQKKNRYFFQKHEGTKSQASLFYRDGIDGEDHLMMDFTQLSDDGTLAPTEIGYSGDGKYTTICLSQDGSDWQEMIVIETETGDEVDRLKDIRFEKPVWSSDNTKFYYTKYPPSDDDFSRKSEDGRVYLHTLGTSQSEDIEIFRPDKPEESPTCYQVTNNSYLAIRTYYSSGMGNKLAIVDRQTTEVTWLHREFNSKSYDVIDILDEYIYIKTNDDAPLNKIIRIPLDNLNLERAELVIPESEHLINKISLAGHHFFIEYLINATSVIKQFTLDGSPSGEIELPLMGTVTAMSGKVNSSDLFYSHTSYPYLPEVYHYNTTTGKTSRLFDNRANFDRENYVLKQVFYPSKDGTQISMFIIHHKDLKLDRTNPCLLWSYGGFNISLTPGASLRERYKVRLMIEEGGVYACPNIRGGGEYGKEWHKAGTKERKQNVFDDFIAAAEYLIDEGYTSPDYIVSHGGSNGGLLVAATLLQRPDLWGATIGEAGVMDMLRYHKFTFGKYWIGDYGNPDEKEGFSYLFKYSPVHNVDEREYPASLFYCADTDTRVVPMHSKKLVAELQHKQQGDAPILLRTETKAGHNFGKPISKVIEETAIMFAFMWQVLDLKIDE